MTIAQPLDALLFRAQMEMICEQYADIVADRDAWKARALTAEPRAALFERKAKDWKDALDMYAKAWAREIGPPYERASHEIDGLVATTRKIRERAKQADFFEREFLKDKIAVIPATTEALVIT